MAMTRSMGGAMCAAWMLLAVCVACGDSAASDDGASGASGAGAGGSGAGGSGAGGSGNGGAGGAGEPGDFDSYWKQASADVTVLETDNPGLPTMHTVELPATATVLDSEGALDAYRQIADDTLVTYAFTEGDTFYYVIRQPLMAADDETYVRLNGSGSEIFTLEDGILVQDLTEQRGDVLVITRTRHRQLAGDFPPSGWPTEAVEYVP